MPTDDPRMSITYNMYPFPPQAVNWLQERDIICLADDRPGRPGNRKMFAEGALSAAGDANENKEQLWANGDR